jgi:DUF4097 and DUF4098 domain-containing protein YvlB
VRARKLGLLFLILAFGGAVETAWNVQHHLDVGPSGCRVLGGKFYGESHSFADTQRRPLPPGARLEIVNAFGSVESALGEAGQLEVALEKVVYLDGEEPARRFADQLQLRIEEEGGLLRVSTNRDALERRDGRVGFETHLRLRVPPGTALLVRNEHGRVDVSDAAALEVHSSYEPVAVRRVAGDATLEVRHGDLSADAIQGALTLNMRYGAVELTNLGGAARLDVEHGDIKVQQAASLSVAHRYGDLTAEDVKGELTVTGEHNGVDAVKVGERAQVEAGYRDVSLRQVAGAVGVSAEHAEVAVSDAQGAVVVKTSYGDVRLSRIAGAAEVHIEHGGLHAEMLAAGLRGEVAGDDVTLDGYQGAVDLQARRAGVRLLPQGRLVDDVRVVVRNGSIELAVPEDSRFELEASVKSGEIELGEIDALQLSVSGGDRVVGRMGEGGGRVALEVEHGDIRLQSREVRRAEQE